MIWKKKNLTADVIENKCDNCRRCVQACSRRALVTAVVHNKMLTFVDCPERCTGCGRCVKVCRNQAIKLIEKYC